MPGFRSFFSAFLPHFPLAKLATIAAKGLKQTRVGGYDKNVTLGLPKQTWIYSHKFLLVMSAIC